MANLGRALNIAIPGTINTLQGIGNIQAQRQQTQQLANENLLFEQEQGRRATKINIKTNPMFLSFDEAGQKQIFDSLFNRGVINEEGVGARGGLEDFVKDIESNSKLFESFLAPQIRKTENDVVAIQNQIKEELDKDTPNEKKIGALRQKEALATRTALTRRGSFEKTLDFIKQREVTAAGLEAKRIEARGKGGLTVSQRLSGVQKEVINILKRHAGALPQNLLILQGEDFFRALQDNPSIMENARKQLDKAGNEKDKQRFEQALQEVDRILGFSFSVTEPTTEPLPLPPGTTLGKQTPSGREVLKDGKVIGHFN